MFYSGLVKIREFPFITNNCRKSMNYIDNNIFRNRQGNAEAIRLIGNRPESMHAAR